jgi:hypothetical protein
MKIIKYLFIGFIILFGVYFFLSNWYESQLLHVNYLKTSYNGIINKIEDGDRGSKDLNLSNGKWITLGSSNPGVYVQVGDSIIKESGSETITVYRKDKNGIWQEKVFK